MTEKGETCDGGGGKGLQNALTYRSVDDVTDDVIGGPFFSAVSKRHVEKLMTLNDFVNMAENDFDAIM